MAVCPPGARLRTANQADEQAAVIASCLWRQTRSTHQARRWISPICASRACAAWPPIALNGCLPTPSRHRRVELPWRYAGAMVPVQGDLRQVRRSEQPDRRSAAWVNHLERPKNVTFASKQEPRPRRRPPNRKAKGPSRELIAERPGLSWNSLMTAPTMPVKCEATVKWWQARAPTELRLSYAAKANAM